MAFQNITAPRGSVRQVAELDGVDIVGTKIRAPLSVYEEVYVLPMENVLPTKVRSLCRTIRQPNLLRAHGV
jgi:leucyl-tRNA synthetase